MTTVESFPQIASFESLLPCLDTPLGAREQGVLALDFDHTLMRALPTLGDEHFYRFLMKQNQEKGFDAGAHYHWTVKVREKIPYETCESVEKINRVIDAYRDKGWKVIILTARILDMKQVTKQHLKGSGLHLTIDDVVFREFSANNRLKTKDESLLEWMQKQPTQTGSTAWRCVFADDSVKYCSEVARLRAKADVRCYHYTQALPNEELSVKQMTELLFQLHAYKKGLRIPYAHDASKLGVTMRAFGIQTLDASALHTVIREIAEADGFPFKAYDKSTL